jgi:hypothetical protein
VDSLYLDVFQNGIKLKAGDDYTATTGTTVVLVQGASANDVVEMVAFDVFSVNDSVSAKDGGSFAGNVAMAGTLGVTGIATFTDDIIIGDGKTIGSASDVDAMAIASNGVVTFSQNTVGAGGMDLLLSSTISSAVALFDITSTYINSTYDEYKLFFSLDTVVDSKTLQGQVFVGGSVVTTTVYQYEHMKYDDSAGAGSNGDGEFFIGAGNCGSVTGEGTTGVMTLYNVNSTDFPFQAVGQTNMHNTSGNHNGGSSFGLSLDISEKGSVVNGFRLFYSGADGSGNTIASGTVKLFGVRS